MLLGAETVSVRRSMIAWAILGGWIMGCTFYLCMIRHEASVLVLGIPPALLSGLAVARATRVRRNIPSVIVGYSVLAAMLCPFTTLLPLGIMAVASPDPWVVLGTVVGGSVVGAFFAAPLGIVFGAIYSWVWRFLVRGNPHGHASLEILCMRFGLALVGLSALLLLVNTVFPSPWPISHMTPFALTRTNVLEWLAFGTLLGGAGIVVFGLLRYLCRFHLAQRIRRGEVEGWAFVPIESVPEADALPRLFAFGQATMVLVKTQDAASGPFRSSSSFEAIARS